MDSVIGHERNSLHDVHPVTAPQRRSQTVNGATVQTPSSTGPVRPPMGVNPWASAGPSGHTCRGPGRSPEAGIRSVCVITGYRADEVREAVGARAELIHNQAWAPRAWAGLLVATPIAIWTLTTDAVPLTARTVLLVFALAIVAWTIWRLPETPVAIGAALVLTAFGLIKDDQLFASLGDDLIWLLIGAFMISAALTSSGVAQRLALHAIRGAASTAALMYRLAAVIFTTALIVPSTSGRAALLLPLYAALAAVICDARVVRALALLFPTVILLSACASLLGAGAHLIAVDLMMRMGLPGLGYVQWAWLGLPFALVSSFAAAFVIVRLFLRGDERRGRLALPTPPAQPMNTEQRNAACIVATVVVLWMLAPLHGVGVALIALAGALAATWAPLTGLSMKKAIRLVEWDLILFLAATMVLGDALVASGAARLVADGLLRLLPGWAFAHGWIVVLAAALVGLLSHLVITSRSARAVILIPTVAVPLAVGELNPAALIFLIVVASGFCQTFAVSAKPVALFSAQDEPAYSDADLLRLSLALLPVMLALLLVFALLIWPLQGLPLTVPAQTPAQ
jgi:solute carrier family 13 (sodium-dependent dicarboxylate transporter), member 2/3/5